MNIYYSTFKSPLGAIYIISGANHLLGLDFIRPTNELMKNALYDDNIKIHVKTKGQLIEYFQGKRTVFEIQTKHLGTVFQINAWKTLCKIPYGEVWSYKMQAMAMNYPNACRAVGAANGKNPLPIIIPCHRVIGSNSKLVGYAGGLEIKKHLLELEGHTIKNNILIS